MKRRQFWILVIGVWSMQFSFAQGDPCQNPDSNKAVIFMQDTFGLDTLYACSDSIVLHTLPVGDIRWTFDAEQDLNDSTTYLYYPLDSSQKAKRSVNFQLRIENECGIFTESFVYRYMNPSLEMPADTTIYIPKNIEIKPTVNVKGISYTSIWNTNQFLVKTNQFEAVAEQVDQSILYKISIQQDTLKGACLVEDSMRITYIDSIWGPVMAEAFTPNGDGNNDVFYVRVGGDFRVDMEIYDRWGKVVFRTSDKMEGWDGTAFGEPVGSGVYTYVVWGTYIDKTTFIEKGKVTLLR